MTAVYTDMREWPLEAAGLNEIEALKMTGGGLWPLAQCVGCHDYLFHGVCPGCAFFGKCEKKGATS